MSQEQRKEREQQKLEIRLIGIDLAHSLSPALQNFVCHSLGLDWKFIATECPTTEDGTRVLHSSILAGGVVTMPWKAAIIPHLEGGVDDVATMLGAVNVVFFDENGKLKGSNVDWVGIEGALKQGGVEMQQRNGVAIVIGAGGAARAAVYALIRKFGVEVIYILNRDEEEVELLRRDCERMAKLGSNIDMIHVRSVEQAGEFPTPSIVVGTVPDFEPSTDGEKAVKDILSSFLARDGDKGVLLDMCYKPRRTRHIQLAEKHGWRTVRGTAVIVHQIEALWQFWASDERLQRFDRDGLWKVMEEELERK